MIRVEGRRAVSTDVDGDWAKYPEHVPNVTISTAAGEICGQARRRTRGRRVRSEAVAVMFGCHLADRASGATAPCVPNSWLGFGHAHRYDPPTITHDDAQQPIMRFEPRAPTLVSHGWTGPTRVDVCEALGMTQVDYEVRGLEAHRFDLGDGEFLRVELYDGYFSIAWSTPLPIGAILRQVRLLLRDAHGDAVLYDAASQAYEDLPADEAITRALAHDASLLLLRLELSDVTLVWKHAAESAPRESGFGQLALLAGRFDEDLCVRVVRQTATPAVAQHSAELIQRASYVADHVRRLLRSALGDAGP